MHAEQSAKLTRRALLTGGVSCAASAMAGYWFGREQNLATRAVAPTRVPPGSKTLTKTQRAAAQPDGLFRVETTERIVALTFDDGPDPLYTPRVLDLLAKDGANATFFLVGVNATAEPDLVARVQGAGHSVGNHTFDHRELELLTVEQVQVEIEKGQAALIANGVPRPRLFRPPKGYTDDVVGVLADADRYRTVFWDGCVERFVDHQPIAEGVAQMLARVRPGSILLAHDGGAIVGSGRTPLSRSRTMDALPLLLDGLARQGFEIVDVPTLLARTNNPLLPRPAPK